jgi:tRNA(adenine34) deaminase
LHRRNLLQVLPLIAFSAAVPARAQTTFVPERRWHDAAVAQRRLAESWGDQSYGAVLVLDGRLIGEGPSRVVKLGDATAHAEREAIRDAQRRLGRQSLQGSVLYSTSRPCAACEAAAAEARVSRMIFGEALRDAGQPRA